MPVSIWCVPADGGEPVNTGLPDLNIWSRHWDELNIRHLSLDPSGRRIAFSLGPTDMHEAWVLEGMPGKI
jgi:hypothetical protein